MRLDLTDLRLFLSIVEAGSITQGAQGAHLALASASERIKRMEDSLGVSLLVRMPRGVVTTEAGEALAHHARLMLRQQAALQEEMREYADGIQASLHLYANTSALSGFLPKKLAPWLAQHPKAYLSLKERTSVDIVRMVAGGWAEAGLVSSVVETMGLQRHALVKDPLVLLVPAQHPLAISRQSTFAQILEDAFVGLAPGNALQEYIQTHARAAGRALRIRVRMKTFEGLMEMVAQGVGLAIVPQVVASRRPRNCVTVRLTDSWAQRDLCLCVKDWTAVSLPMQSLLLHLGARPELLCATQAVSDAD